MCTHGSKCGASTWLHADSSSQLSVPAAGPAWRSCCRPAGSSKHRLRPGPAAALPGFSATRPLRTAQTAPAHHSNSIPSSAAGHSACCSCLPRAPRLLLLLPKHLGKLICMHVTWPRLRARQVQPGSAINKLGTLPAAHTPAQLPRAQGRAAGPPSCRPSCRSSSFLRRSMRSSSASARAACASARCLAARGSRRQRQRQWRRQHLSWEAVCAPAAIQLDSPSPPPPPTVFDDADAGERPQQVEPPAGQQAAAGRGAVQLQALVEVGRAAGVSLPEGQGGLEDLRGG